MNTATLPATSSGRHSFSRWWDRMSIYLPVLLMMLLALASYWLLRATPIPEEPGPKPEVTHEPDYFMQRFSVKVFEPNGALKTELYGTAARHHPDVGTLEGTVFVLEGNAAVVRQAGKGADGQPLPRLEFHGEYLRVSTEPEHIMSDQPVLLVRDQDQITADNLDYSGDARVAVLTGHVRALFAPRP